METTKIRSRMAVSERAKQFMPFKAVTGLDEALERKRLELGIVERKELSEEELKEIIDYDVKTLLPEILGENVNKPSYLN